MKSSRSQHDHHRQRRSNRNHPRHPVNRALEQDLPIEEKLRKEIRHEECERVQEPERLQAGCALIQQIGRKSRLGSSRGGPSPPREKEASSVAARIVTIERLPWLKKCLPAA
jgi:hypothetical protein